MKSRWKQEDLKPVLDLGLTKNQAIIYFTALERGFVSASEIAKATGINRQQVYVDTDKLLSLGLLDITRKQRKKFIAADPRVLDRMAQEKVSHAHDVATRVSQNLPFLQELKEVNGSRCVSVKYYEGAGRVKAAYLKELETCNNTEVLSFVGSVDDLFQFFPEGFWKQWNKKFVQKRNTSKMLVQDTNMARETIKHDKRYARKSRHIDPFPLKVNVDVFGDNVLIVSVYDELAIWISSPVIADSYRILFKTCWGFVQDF